MFGLRLGRCRRGLRCGSVGQWTSDWERIGFVEVGICVHVIYGGTSLLSLK
jgi:hypothetical protein